MQTRNPDLELGQEWGYREKAGVPVLRVVVTRIGTSRPQRVRVRFADESFEGLEEWVPPARLKAPWDQATAWQEREDRWSAVREDSGDCYDSPEYWAAVSVFDVAPIEREVSIGYNRNAGLLFVSDPGTASSVLDVDPEEFLGHPLCFVDVDGQYIAPWPVTLRIAKMVAPRFAEEILSDITENERRAACSAVYGEYYGGRNPMYISPETCAHVDMKKKPVRELLRQWCGAREVERHDELIALRAEVLRVGQVAERAIRALSERGGKREARSLEQELGVPVALLRASQHERR